MSVAITAIIATLIFIIFSDVIKKHAVSVYIVVSALVILISGHNLIKMLGFTVTYAKGLDSVVEFINKGTLSTGLFILVMYMGVFTLKSSNERKLKKNRGELSIIASLLIIPHIVLYIAQYISQLDFIFSLKSFGFENLSIISAGVLTIIMLPLFITSFMTVRRKMNPKYWKRLQSLAYIFYALIYVHVITAIIFTSVEAERMNDFINVGFYTLIFLGYLLLRKAKAREELGKAEKNIDNKKMENRLNKNQREVISR